MTDTRIEPVDPTLVARSDTPARPTRQGNRFLQTTRRLFMNRGAGIGVVVVLLLFAFAFIGPLVSPWQYSQIDYTSFTRPPSAAHWFGTNGIGQDVFAQTARGMQKSLLIGLLVAVFSTAIAAITGAAAGYFGGWVDRLVMFFVDMLLVLPSFLIIAIISPRIQNAGWIVLVVLITVFGWMITARVVRAMTLSVKEREFVRAARYMGIGPFRIIFRHILPNVASFLIIDGTIQVATAVLGETTLSYFGFGVQAPDVSLGTLIAQNQDSALTSPWLFYFAAGALVIFAIAANLIGDGLRDALDPTSTTGKREKRNRRRDQNQAAVDVAALNTQAGSGA
ncbi:MULTISPECIES: ABC transporter permease [unclassified Curtobacterium]|jgi:peptide/nickel transport system permease protein|uniref:ABC transporter permease n=1 Tax=unclassified Curtobacterium TaxID=257496 RepID=UPI00188B0FF3|nr:MULTISPECIES: ABC transporter permease [unclassified Curtobacterium]MBF4589866.1 ABC transporter permease [Curtobacterium sp. VKM Ac-1395]MCY1694495.1 ABC transporter permease [Curtobacterium sp. SL109]